MFTSLTQLFDSSGFMPHGMCYMWRTDIVALHVVSDALIGLSYLTLPAFLVVLIKHRPEIRTTWMFHLFAAFILLCGLTHFMGIWTISNPDYLAQGLLKAMTASVSVATAISAWTLLPRLLTIPTPAELARVNEQLHAEIAERERTEVLLEQRAEELAASNQSLEEFAYHSSHDLKAPLRGIENLATWIAEDVHESASPETLEHLRLLRSRVNRMERLLDDLLAYSRAGQDAINTAESIDLEAMVREWFEVLDVDNRFELELELGVRHITAARAPLEQVLRNLIGNAMKHHDKEHGQIRIVTTESAHGCEFTVIDDGPGILPEYRTRVMGMYQTLKPRDEIEGSGMGLAIIKKIIERVGGTLSVDSVSPTRRGLSCHFLWPYSVNMQPAGPTGENDEQ